MNTSKAPDKIYVREYNEGIASRWDRIKQEKSCAKVIHEYIRKDALLEWAKELTSKPYDGTTESAHKHQIANYLREKYNSL